MTGVKGVEIRSQGQSGWVKLDPAWGANWQTSGVGNYPLDLRLMPNDGSAPLVAT